MDFTKQDGIVLNKNKNSYTNRLKQKRNQVKLENSLKLLEEKLAQVERILNGDSPS